MNPSYWELTAHRTPDVMVVGAGLVGLSAALHLAEQGLRVTVLEAQPGLANASTRNAGFACFGSAGEIWADVATLGLDATRARVRLRWEGLRLLRERLGDDAIGYAPTGGYELFPTEAEAAAVLPHLPEINRLLADITQIPETYRAGQSNGYAHSLTRLEGSLHSGRLMQHLLTCARRQGVDVRFGAAVQQVAPGAVTLATGEALPAPRVLLAAGAHTSTLWPEVVITPARGLILVTAPLPQLAWRGTWHYHQGFVYWREVDGRLMLGGARHVDKLTEATREPGVNPAIQDWLVQFATQILHLPAGWRTDYVWSGTMGFAADDTPFVSAVAPGIWVAAGLGGIGVATGVALGRQAVEMIQAA